MSDRQLTDMDIAAVCTGKVRFETGADARDAIRHIQRRGKPWTNRAYKCPACKGWHQGRLLKGPKL